MATSGLYGNTAASNVALPSGSETSGLYGNNTVFGGTYFEWFVFQTANLQPATPTGGSWDFTTNTGTAPTGWSSAVPASPTATVWVSIGLVNSRSSTAITWSTPGQFSYSSGLPVLSGTGTPASGLGLTGQLYIQTDTAPESIWFNQVGTWTKLTGSTLYVDLTSNQTIAGIKTFASQIQGSVSGTSSNVTGIVAVGNGGTGVTTSTGTGSVVLSTSPTLVTPALGTPVSGVASNLTGLPLTTGVTGLLPVANGGTGTATPALVAGTNISITGTWPNQTINSTNSGGTVTSVAATVPAFLSISGSPITTSGTLAITYSGTALPVANGGTGVTTSTGTGSVVLSTSATLVTPTLSGAVVGNSAPYLNFTSTTAPSYNSGRFWYDSTQDSLSFNNVVTNNTIHIGQEIQLRVLNSTGSTIAAGAPVYITSTASGQIYPNVALAKADSISTSVVIGMANQAIPTGTVGYVTTAGVVAGLSTGTYAVGDILYLSPYSAGQVMNTIPPTGYPVKVGVVSYSNSPNGQIYINQQNYFVQAANVVGTLAVANGGTGVTTSTGTGGVVLSTSPTLVTPALGTPSALVGTNITGTAAGLSIGGNAATATTATNVSGGTSSVTSETVSGNLTLSGGTANGVAYLNGSKVVTTGSALTFDGTNFATTGTVTANGRSKFIGASEPFAVYLRYNGSTNGVYLGSSAADILNAYDSAGNPLYQFGGTADVFYIGGSEQMRLTSTGLGIGTSSPAYKLDVNGVTRLGAGNSAILAGVGGAFAGGQGELYTLSTYNLGIGTTGAAALRMYTNSVLNATLDSSGNLGLGVTPSAWVTSRKAIQVGLGASWQGSTGTYSFSDFGANFYFNGTNELYLGSDYATKYRQISGAHSWYNAPSGTAGNAITFTQAMTLDASGNLLVGKTSASNYGDGVQIYPAGTIGLGHPSGTGSGAAYALFGYAGGGIGSITQSGTTAVLYNVTSDQRLKENIVDAPEFGNVIDAIQVRSYDWKADHTHQRAGFIAQELVTVAPEAVHQPADPEEMMAVDYSKLVPMLVKEIQDLRKRLAAAGIA